MVEPEGFWDQGWWVIVAAGLILLAMAAMFTFSDPEFWKAVLEVHERCRADPGCQFVQS